MEKKYKNLEDVLSEGRHQIKLYPKNEWDDEKKEFKRDTHRSGTSKTGNKFWMYQTKIGEEYIGVLAFDEEQKRIYDQIDVEVNVIQKVDSATKEPIWKVVNEKPVKVLKAYINEIKDKTVIGGTDEEKKDLVASHSTPQEAGEAVLNAMGKEPLPTEPEDIGEFRDLPF